MACSAKHFQMYSSELSRIRILKFENDGVDVPVACRQCVPAPCVNSCPVSALHKDAKTGGTITDADLCTGCGACVEACPFAAAQLSPDGTALICDLCAGAPACAQVCPVRAVVAAKERRSAAPTLSGAQKRMAVAREQKDKVMAKWQV